MNFIKFRATEDQIRKIAVNAIHASSPMGMGYLHFVPGDHFKPEDISISPKVGIYLDYVQGRMVKLSIIFEGDNTWTMSNDLDVEYQSWAAKYPTGEDLLKSVEGIEILRG